MKNAIFFKIYIVFSIVYLIVLFRGNENLDLFLKPALIPLLGFGVYFHRKFPSRKILLAGLLFSWIGDVILLFADIAEIYFILGLVCFLIAHLSYCVLFNKQISGEIHFNKVLFALGSLLIAGYLIGMVSFLMPKLGDLKIPVIVYAAVISTMVLFAFNGYLIWKKPGALYVFLGASIFVLSDSILAINKFHAPIEKSVFFIMLTYLVAQYLIVMGIIKLNKKISPEV
ncbi:lysoplasmalogenase [Flavobacterium psychroterrae]|uniref:Lysoplasmalogenase n=1 Tax=Flavobacterium psychroterrae TaxID=2133767 RepID=A0ABS5PED6_9FLAO|nr:lysoplasmalogenase [Flavobacterium psychroterrae]MBS7232657.1 lysoplasmalogenase [Flavobacterium psychroterrae]